MVIKKYRQAKSKKKRERYWHWQCPSLHRIKETPNPKEKHLSLDDLTEYLLENWRHLGIGHIFWEKNHLTRSYFIKLWFKAFLGIESFSNLYIVLFKSIMKYYIAVCKFTISRNFKIKFRHSTSAVIWFGFIKA